MKVLLVDGTWSLKRHFHRVKDDSDNNAVVFGFLSSLKKVINQIFPDRVIVCWDGFNGGKYRHDIYPQYKSNRDKKWDMEVGALSKPKHEMTPKELETLELFELRLSVKNFLEDLYIRQVEVDYIEADDLIAHYAINSPEEDEVYIYTRDGDFPQLISDNIYIINPDSMFALNKKTYEEKRGHVVDNELLFKCFEGDKSDCISGVNGITRDTLIKHFPDIAKEKYTYDRLVEECYEKQKVKKYKVYEKIINCRDVLYRNARLMNLKKPFLNDKALQELSYVRRGKLSSDRSMQTFIQKFLKNNMTKFLYNQNIDLFLAPFYHLISKEIENTNKK